MAVNKDLKIYKKSKEFQDILEKCKNKIKNIETEIDTIYENWEQYNELTKNEFDVKDQWVKDLNWILDQIKEKKKADELITFYEYRLENAQLFLYQAINKTWFSNSILRYTDLDMRRFERSHFFWLEHDIDSLIWTEETKIDTDWAF